MWLASHAQRVSQSNWVMKVDVDHHALDICKDINLFSPNLAYFSGLLTN